MEHIVYEVVDSREVRVEDINFIEEIFREAWGGYNWVEEIEWYLYQKYQLVISRRKHDDRIIGVLFYRFFPGVKVMHLNYIAVKKEYRNKSIGSTMLKIIVNMALKNSFEYIFGDTLYAIDFYLKNSFLVAKGIVLTAPSEPPSYLIVYPCKNQRYVAEELLVTFIKHWVRTVYDENERRLFKKYFDLIFWNIRTVSQFNNKKIPLDREKFLEELKGSATCENIPTIKLKELIEDILRKMF